MKLHLSQLQYAVSEKVFNDFHDKKITVDDLPIDKCVASLTKEIDIGTAPTPHIGECISDSYWPSDYSEHRVIGVTYSYSENICYVGLEPFVMVENSLAHTEIEKISTLHGWKYSKIR